MTISQLVAGTMRIFHLRRVSRAFVLFIVLACGSASATASHDVTLLDDSQGCFHHWNKSMVYDRQGEFLVAQGTRKQLPVQELVELIRIAKESEIYSHLDLNLLGVTPEAVAAHKKQIIAASITSDLPNDILKKNIALFNYPNVSKQLTTWLTYERNSTTRVSFRVRIAKGPLTGDDIEITSNTELPGMLPWTVKAGKRSWSTYSIALSKQLANFADKDGPCAKLVDCSSFWRTEFWNDRTIWEDMIGEELQRDFNETTAKSLPGYSEAAKIFTLRRCNRGHVSPQPDSLHIWVTTESPELIRSVGWYNLLDKHGNPMYDWNHLLSRYQSCCELVKQKPWLVDWLKAAPDRTIEISVADRHCHLDTEEFVNTYTLPYWRDAKLKGEPFAELRLKEKNEVAGKLWLSDQDHVPALIREIRPAKTAAMLDQQSVGNDSTRTYLLGDDSGHFQRCRLAKVYANALDAHFNRLVAEEKRRYAALVKNFNTRLAKKKRTPVQTYSKSKRKHYRTR